MKIILPPMAGLASGADDANAGVAQRLQHVLRAADQGGQHLAPSPTLA